MFFLYESGGLILCQSDSSDQQSSLQSEQSEERYLVDFLVRSRYGLSLERRVNGSPYLVGDNRCVSISHTGKIIALYVSDFACGVDIEYCTRNASRIARKFTDSEEILIARQVYPKNPELLIWCAKEALYKICVVDGAEFRSDFKLVSVEENKLYCVAFGDSVELNYFEINDLLIVYGSR